MIDDSKIITFNRYKSTRTGVSRKKDKLGRLEMYLLRNLHESPFATNTNQANKQTIFINPIERIECPNFLFALIHAEF